MKHFSRHRSGRARACVVVCALLYVWGGVTQPVHAQQARADTLVEALEREEDLLETELATIRARRKAFDEESSKRVVALQEQVARQRSRQEAAWANVLELERELRELDIKLDTLPARDQAQTSGSELDKLARELDVKPGEETSQEDRARRVFTRAAARILEGSRVRRQRAEFFSRDGARVTGTVIYVGEVAAAGLSEQGERSGGVLVPSRDVPDAFQVIKPDAARIEAYLEGSASSLPLLIYDPRRPPDMSELDEQDTAQTVSSPRTWRDTVRDAAPVGYIILALGAIAAAIVVMRLFVLARLTLTEHAAGKRLLGIMHAHHESRDLTELQEYARSHDTALSRVTQQALMHRTLPLELYENSIQASLLLEIGRVSRGLSALRAIAAVSPLLGLLGTVIGMIATFEVLTTAGSANDPQALSGGIAQALATTQLGLIVAVPALLAYSGLRSLAGQMETYIEHVAVEIATHIRELSLEDGETHAHHHHHHEEHT